MGAALPKPSRGSGTYHPKRGCADCYCVTGVLRVPKHMPTTILFSRSIRNMSLFFLTVQHNTCKTRGRLCLKGSQNFYRGRLEVYRGRSPWKIALAKTLPKKLKHFVDGLCEVRVFFMFVGGQRKRLLPDC